MSASQLKCDMMSSLYVCPCPCPWPLPSWAPLKAVLAMARWDGVGLYICRFSCSHLAVQRGCGRCPCNVRVATEVQFARYTLVKMTFFFFFLQLLSQKHRASYMKSTIWKSRTRKSLVNGFKSKLKIELSADLWAFDFLNPHIGPVFRSNRSLCEMKENARFVTILRDV